MRFEVKNFRYNVFHLAVIFLLLLVAWSSFRVLRRSFGRFAGDFMYPYMEFSRSAVGKAGDLSLLRMSKLELLSRLEYLDGENRRLAAQAAIAGELLVQNELLRKMHGLNVAPGWRSVPAEIVMRDAWFWNESLRIDKGLRDGIRVGAAVAGVAPDGRLLLLGVVTACGTHSSEVSTVFNPELKMSVSLPLSGATGVLNFGRRRETPDGTVPLGFLPQMLHYTGEEAVLTSGFEQGIPAGMKVGVLEQLNSSGGIYSNELFMTGRVRPAVNLSKMRFLIVLSRLDQPESGGGK